MFYQSLLHTPSPGISESSKLIVPYICPTIFKDKLPPFERAKIKIYNYKWKKN